MQCHVQQMKRKAQVCISFRITVHWRIQSCFSFFPVNPPFPFFFSFFFFLKFPGSQLIERINLLSSYSRHRHRHHLTQQFWGIVPAIAVTCSPPSNRWSLSVTWPATWAFVLLWHSTRAKQHLKPTFFNLRFNYSYNSLSPNIFLALSTSIYIRCYDRCSNMHFFIMAIPLILIIYLLLKKFLIVECVLLAVDQESMDLAISNNLTTMIFIYSSISIITIIIPWNYFLLPSSSFLFC